MHPKIPHPRIPHPIVHDPEHIKGVRTVATVEFTKGILVVLAGMGVLSMRHKDIVGVAESLLEFLHVNAHHHHYLFGVFIHLAYRISDVRLWKVAVVVAVYVTLRFVEAYGLWYVRPWGEWLAFGLGAIYVPFEAVDLLRHPTWFRLLIIVVNVGMMIYIMMISGGGGKKRDTSGGSV